jgi:CRISPR-associated helicase Cas3
VVQQLLVDRVAEELGVDLAAIAPVRTPRRAEQLAISGAVIMADWIASSDQQFIGMPHIADVCMDRARERAENAWHQLRLRGGWNPAALTLYPDQVKARFGKPSRPVQHDAVTLAAQIPVPGLLIVEAPMGEGKTEAALAAVEVFASRFGADGVFVGMPTQATSDPMFSRVRAWADTIEPGLPVGLLHGKRRFNKEWKRLEQSVQITGVDDFGCCDGDYGMRAGERDELRLIPAEWFLGPKRGLLSALTVGTIDHLLYAATRTRHVMLRHAGLAGRVVVLDEVHAYDVYMSQFLFEALRWLADGGVPVVLLSATLPPRLRRELVAAYLQGATGERDVDLSGLPEATGYPSTMSVCAVDGQPHFQTRASAPWRASASVEVEVQPEDPDDGPEAVVELLREALREGGCALVVRNTVHRAQQTYAAVTALFGKDAVLLHARMTATARADRTERVLGLLGAPDRPGAPRRPDRFVVVATQLAEQSFDVDVDLLITDLAPIDLLLQRIGRLHRHARPDTARPPPLRAPRVVVAGMAPWEDGPPRFPGGSRTIYGDYLLLHCAALVDAAAAGGGWSVPAEVPSLVARGYSEQVDELPSRWRDAAEGELPRCPLRHRYGNSCWTSLIRPISYGWPPTPSWTRFAGRAGRRSCPGTEAYAWARPWSTISPRSCAGCSADCNASPSGSTRLKRPGKSLPAASPGPPPNRYSPQPHPPHSWAAAKANGSCTGSAWPNPATAGASPRSWARSTSASPMRRSPNQEHHDDSAPLALLAAPHRRRRHLGSTWSRPWRGPGRLAPRNRPRRRHRPADVALLHHSASRRPRIRQPQCRTLRVDVVRGAPAIAAHASPSRRSRAGHRDPGPTPVRQIQRRRGGPPLLRRCHRNHPR